MAELHLNSVLFASRAPFPTEFRRNRVGGSGGGGAAGTAAWCMLTGVVIVSEAHGPCGEYGCDLTCNHGGCQEVARVCPVGFSMTETAVGIRCTGERPGSSRERQVGRGSPPCRPRPVSWDMLE